MKTQIIQRVRKRTRLPDFAAWSQNLKSLDICSNIFPEEEK